jgi:dTDP-glucose 4,6-dehydratase
MRVIVTGGLGFIGSAVVRLLVGEGEHEVLNLDKVTYAASPEAVTNVSGSARYRFVRADIADGQAMKRVFAEYQPDAVIHLAAES